MLIRALSVFGSFGVGIFGDVDQAALVRTEVAAGIAPESPGAEPEPTFTAELTPAYGVRARSERSSVTLKLAPRLYYRVPNLGDFERPLVLGRGSVGTGHRLSELVNWTTSVDAEYGELEFANTRLALDAPIPLDRLDPVVDVTSVDGQSGLTWQVTPRYSLELGVLAGYTSLRGDSDLNLPETTTLGADLVQRWQLDPRSWISFPLSPRYYFVDPDPDTFSVSLQAIYERQLSQRDTLTASAGVTVLKEEDREIEGLPRGSIGLSSIVVQRPGLRWTNDVSAGVDVLLDPTLGELRPIALFALSERADFGTRWTMTFEVRASTSATSDPIDEEVTARLRDGETDLSGSLLWAYRATELLRFDFGLRASTQGSHLAAENFEFIDEQVWAFVGLSFLFGLGTAEPPDFMR